MNIKMFGSYIGSCRSSPKFKPTTTCGQYLFELVFCYMSFFTIFYYSFILVNKIGQKDAFDDKSILGDKSNI